MAKAEFPKGSEEYQMFVDYWNLCKKFWIVENNEEYWDSLIAETDKFYKKYRTAFSRALAVELANELERKSKGIGIS